MNYIGIDLGGTNIKGALVSAKGEILKEHSIPTRVDLGPEAVAGRIGQVIAQLSIGEDTVGGVGVGCPGTVDDASGIVRFAANLNFVNFDLRSALRAHTALPIHLGNDANAAALGEALFGCGRGAESTIVVTLGTGVGAGVVIGGKLYCGRDTGAGEIGSIPYLDRDYEYYCSSRFFVGRGTSGKEAYERALAGDSRALELWQEFGTHIGQLVMLALYAYDPQAIVFGGSISHAFGFFRDAMYEQLKQFPYAKTVERLHICCSGIEYVGLLGASACE